MHGCAEPTHLRMEEITVIGKFYGKRLVLLNKVTF